MSPMAGVSDSPGRIMSRRFGADFTFTEFGSADFIGNRDPDTLKLYSFQAEERPIVFQIFASNVASARRAVQVLAPLQPDQFDLNMGCSVNRVAMKGAGAALLKTPEKAARILEAMRAESGLPVSAKIRIGWEDSDSVLEIGEILQQSGICSLFVHGRTAAQRYRGQASHAPALELAHRLSIPVFANGDLETSAEAQALIDSSELSGALIGRASIGNPFLFSEDSVSFEKRLQTALDHLELSIDFHGPRGLFIFRKHLAGYLSFLSQDQRRPYLMESSVEILRRSLQNLQASDPAEFVAEQPAQKESGPGSGPGNAASAADSGKSDASARSQCDLSSGCEVEKAGFPPASKQGCISSGGQFAA